MVAFMFFGISLASVVQAIVLNSYNTKNPLIISHRGSPFLFPEHSFAGYNYAISHGSQFIEQDVNTSADGQLFVSHDNNLKRTTNDNIDITKATSAQIKKACKSNGEPLRTLAQVFAKYGKTTNYVIETKKSGMPAFYMERDIIHTIEAYHLQKHVILQSLKQTSLDYMHNMLPQAIYMRLLPGKPNEEATMEALNGIPSYVNIVSGYLPCIDANIVNKIHSMGMMSMPYCVDTKDQANQVKLENDDGFFSDVSYTIVKYFPKENASEMANIQTSKGDTKLKTN